MPASSAAALKHVDRRSYLIFVSTFLGFAIPMASYLWMIHAYGVNVIYWDQWDDINLIGHAFSGTLHFSMLWSQHFENRIFFPNLVVLALAYSTHLNVVTEEYLSALMLFGGTALVICNHKRRSPARRWIWYCPVAFLLLSLAQAGNALWGFQMAWYLVLLMVALSLFLLDNEPPSWLALAFALGAAVIATFSSLQGLLVWPAGLLLIYLRRRPRHFIVVWMGAAVLAGTTYFVGFNFNVLQSNKGSLAALATFFVRLIGDVVGESDPGSLETIFGSVLILVSIWALVRFVLQARTGTGGRPFALSLLLFGLLFSGVTALGRSGIGASGVNVEGRYTVFAVFVLVGLYLVVLDPRLASELPSSEQPHNRRPRREPGARRGVLSDPLLTLARLVVGVGVVLTVVFGSINGISQARWVRDIRLYVGRITVGANHYPNGLVVPNLVYYTESPQTIRRQITIAQDDRLSLFATSDAGKYLSEGPLPLAPLRAAMILPRNGFTLHAKQLLDVIVTDSYDVTSVNYFLSGPGMAKASIATGSQTQYGWIARWNTSTVLNGGYKVDAIVRDADGRSATTRAVEVRVHNA
ncbi:MAG TPA: hypothetical protein VEJ84_09790 [Acidimicrobiales bacterium]|nr:hypothetical protein [Acidimicrobiales bacterium]